MWGLQGNIFCIKFWQLLLLLVRLLVLAYLGCFKPSNLAFPEQIIQQYSIILVRSQLRSCMFLIENNHYLPNNFPIFHGRKGKVGLQR